MNRKFILQFYGDPLTKLSLFKEFKIMHSSNPILRTQSLGSYRKTIKHYSYFLTDKIGRGYSSTVYIGHNDYTGEKVAIKVIELKFIKDLHAKRMLDNQLQCMSKVRHPRLLHLIDTYSTNNNIYIISEFCEGGDLQKHLKTKIRYNQSQLAYFMSQFYPAYLTLLEAGFIHRDLKPANILIKRNKIRIADFGIVKRTTQLAKDPYNIGTTAYMSPQSLYQNIFDQKTDVWSIGIMCYQLLHGRLPWKCESNNRQKLKYEILHTSISYDSSSISLDCIVFLSRCLDRNPAARISIHQMMKNNWMQKMVAPLIKKQNEKRKKANSIMINQVMGKRQQSLPPNSFKHLSTHEIITKEKDQILVNPELQLKQCYKKQQNRIGEHESPKRAPLYKFTYESRNNQNSNNSNIQMGVESTFQKMRLKIKGSLPSINYQLPLNQIKIVNSSERFVRLLINYCRDLMKVMVNTEFIQIQSLLEGDRKRLLDILLDELIKRIGELKTIVETGQNIFHLKDWQAYKTSQQWISNRDSIIKLIDKCNEKMKNKEWSIKMGNQNRIKQHFDKDMRDGLCRIKNYAQAIISQGKIDKNEELLSLMQLAEHFMKLFQTQKIISSYCKQYSNECLLSYLDSGRQQFDNQQHENIIHLSQFSSLGKDKVSREGADLRICWEELKCKLQALL